MKKILVTGANGLLGQKLVFLLSKQKDVEVIPTGRGPARIDFQDLKYLDIDLSNRNQVFEKVLKAAPSHIMHAAAITQVDVCERDQEFCWTNNVIASENLVEASKELNAYFQYMSTDFVFDGKGGPYQESDLPNPVNIYGKSKYAVEQILASSPLEYSIVRTVLVYGVGENMSRSNLVLWVKNKLEKGEPIRVVNDQWRTPTLVEDLAMGCNKVLEKNATGIFHISGKDYVTPYDMAMQVADLFELDKRLISPTNASEFQEVGTRPLRTGFDISRARKELGYEPVTLEQGLHIVREQLGIRE